MNNEQNNLEQSIISILKPDFIASWFVNSVLKFKELLKKEDVEFTVTKEYDERGVSANEDRAFKYTIKLNNHSINEVDEIKLIGVRVKMHPKSEYAKYCFCIYTENNNKKRLLSANSLDEFPSAIDIKDYFYIQEYRVESPCSKKEEASYEENSEKYVSECTKLYDQAKSGIENQKQKTNILSGIFRKSNNDQSKNKKFPNEQKESNVASIYPSCSVCSGLFGMVGYLAVKNVKKATTKICISSIYAIVGFATAAVYCKS